MLEPKMDINSFIDFFPGPVIYTYGGVENISSTMRGIDASLALANRQGKPVYFVPNELKGHDRKDTEIVRCRSVFLDDDKHVGPSRADTFPIPPNLELETSPGKWHYHWLTDTDQVEEWKAVINGMIAEYDTDPACRNPARIMRLPGFINTKEQYKGWVVSVNVLREAAYDWSEILAAFPPMDAEISQLPTGPRPKFKLEEKIAAAIAGEEVHANLASVCMHYANTGMDQDEAYKIVMGLIEFAVDSGTVDRARAMERIGNMRQRVGSAYAKVQSETSNIEAIRPPKRLDSKFTALPRPPGALAEVADDIMGYMQFPSWEMAIPVAMHCVSMFGGGIYRLGITTGCRKREILAGSSRGKSICSRYPKEIMRRLSVGDKHFKHNPYDYGGSAAWTPTAIHADLVAHRVRGYTVTEGGLDKKSKAGSTEEMRKLWLDALTASHKSHLESKQYSMRNGAGINDKLVDVYGAVVVQLVESVPVHYVEALRGSHSHEGGDTGRTEVVFVPEGRPKRNRQPENDISDLVVDMMQLYIRKFEEMNCMGGDDPTNPDKFIIIDDSQIQEAWYDLDDEITDRMNSGQLNGVQEAITGRYMERLNTTIYIQAITDAAYARKDLAVPVATMEHFEYAVAYQDELSRSLFANLEGGVLDDPLSRCVAKIASRMDNFGELAVDKIGNTLPRDRIVSKQWVTKVLNNCGDWKALMSICYNKREAAERELYNALESDGILIPVSDTGKVKKWRLNK